MALWELALPVCVGTLMAMVAMAFLLGRLHDLARGPRMLLGWLFAKRRRCACGGRCRKAGCRCPFCSSRGGRAVHKAGGRDGGKYKPPKRRAAGPTIMPAVGHGAMGGHATGGHATGGHGAMAGPEPAVVSSIGTAVGATVGATAVATHNPAPAGAFRWA